MTNYEIKVADTTITICKDVLSLSRGANNMNRHTESKKLAAKLLKEQLDTISKYKAYMNDDGLVVLDNSFEQCDNVYTNPVIPYIQLKNVNDSIKALMVYTKRLEFCERRSFINKDGIIINLWGLSGTLILTVSCESNVIYSMTISDKIILATHSIELYVPESIGNMLLWERI